VDPDDRPGVGLSAPPPAIDLLEPPEAVHILCAMNSEIDGRKRVRRWTVKTGCGLDLVIERQSPDQVPIIQLGLTVWFSQITCAPCLVCSRKKSP